MGRFGRLTGWGVVGLAALLAGCAGAPDRRDGDPVRIAGTGRPVLVLQAGLGDGKDRWGPVVDRLARVGTVFAYDRPGYGLAPSVDGPRDPCTIAGELRALLRSRGLPPPYVLVGHSLGGLYQYVYARLYPDEVAGYVLIDPTHPDHRALLERDMPGTTAMLGVVLALDDTRRREFRDQAACLDRLDTRRPLSMPGRVLTAGRPSALASAEFEGHRLALARTWPRLTGSAYPTSVVEAGHYIHREAPEVVLEAVAQVAGLAGFSQEATPGSSTPSSSTGGGSQAQGD